ncbi:hypothetical protein [uncultured Clostridium sp.]|uniref:hypothetical protein n=1 Tax=uncultured Clostridium sp. TaxID=59620 RepID=UPI00260E91D1|nr:hypothetical protein [uncultured Clostridium sp.]
MNEKKIIKTLCKDKKIKELVKEGQDAIAVFASRLFNVPVSECVPIISSKPEIVQKANQRYEIAYTLAKAMTLKDFGYLVEWNIASSFKSLFEEKIIVEVPVKVTPTKKSTTKKSTAKKTTSKKVTK